MLENEYEIYNNSKYISLPAYENLNSYNIYFRRLFDDYGYISRKNILNNIFYCEININKDIIYEEVIAKIKELYKVTDDNIFYNVKTLNIFFEDIDTLNFLSKIYKNSDARYRDEEKYRTYKKWITTSACIPKCSFKIIDKDSILPYSLKNIEYNITIIKEVEKICNNLVLYDTGIIFIPNFGLRIKIVPDISLLKKGYTIQNYSTNSSTSDTSETLKILLLKIDNTLPDIVLPFCCGEMLLENFNYYEFEKVDDDICV
jgi:hypothetical protein